MGFVKGAFGVRQRVRELGGDELFPSDSLAIKGSGVEQAGILPAWRAVNRD
jgi:hypothetical protein